MYGINKLSYSKLLTAYFEYRTIGAHILTNFFFLNNSIGESKVHSMTFTFSFLNHTLCLNQARRAAY